jgi:hypothetical protein
MRSDLGRERELGRDVHQRMDGVVGVTGRPDDHLRNVDGMRFDDVGLGHRNAFVARAMDHEQRHLQPPDRRADVEPRGVRLGVVEHLRRHPHDLLRPRVDHFHEAVAAPLLLRRVVPAVDMRDGAPGDHTAEVLDEIGAEERHAATA